MNDNDAVIASVADLAYWLGQAKEAHAAHEAEHGPDPDWPQWYARWIVSQRKQNGWLPAPPREEK